MIDFEPLAKLAVLGIAAVIVILVLALCSIFVSVPIWTAIPSTALTYVVLRAIIK